MMDPEQCRLFLSEQVHLECVDSYIVYPQKRLTVISEMQSMINMIGKILSLCQESFHILIVK